MNDNIVIPKIKLDDQRKHIINKDEILEYIKYYINDEQLLKFKNDLVTQTKVSNEEVISLINSIDERMLMFNNFNNIKNDFNKLEEFYNSNLVYIGNAFIASEKHDLSSNVENLIISFLDYSITREEQGIQNSILIQNLFNKLKYIYESAYLTKKDNIPKLYKKIKDIMDRKDNLINKVDESANSYSDLTQTTVLRLSGVKNPGHSITDDDLDKSKIAGFVVTSIVLQSSIVLSLILSLIALFNK